MNKKYEAVLKEQIDKFLSRISDECSINSKKLHFYRSDFPIFKPANAAYFEYQHYEDTLEKYIREYLITPVFIQWLTISGFRCKRIKMNNSIKKVSTRYSNESYGLDFLFAFLVECQGKQIAYRYSSLCLSDNEIQNKMQHFHIDHFEIIDWSDTDSLLISNENRGLSPFLKNRVLYITLRKFLLSYFNKDLASLYVTSVQDTVKKANQLIGFQTIPMLSLRHLSEFKSSFLTSLNDFPLSTKRYVKFSDAGELTNDTLSLLQGSDLDIIIERCFRNKLFHVLLGNEKFARCFITSEYLFDLFMTGNQHSFDYSTVVSGYFKSVELLLEKVMLVRLDNLGADTLWIKCKHINDKDNFNKLIKNSNLRKNPSPNAKNNYQVKFIKENMSYFSTEMAPLIWFLHDDEKNWYISDSAKQIIHDSLLNYSKGCRNEHLHKDIINDIATMKAVRDNTILCLLYIIGGRVLLPSTIEDYNVLGAFDNSYDRLYKKIIDVHRIIYVFYFQFDNSREQRVIRLFEQENAKYDEYGHIISKILFVRADVPTPNEYDISTKKINDFSTDEIIELSPSNIPKKIWWENDIRGKTEIEW